MAISKLFSELEKNVEMHYKETQSITNPEGVKINYIITNSERSRQACEFKLIVQELEIRFKNGTLYDNIYYI